MFRSAGPGSAVLVLELFYYLVFYFGFIDLAYYFALLIWFIDLFY